MFYLLVLNHHRVFQNWARVSRQNERQKKKIPVLRVKIENFQNGLQCWLFWHASEKNLSQIQVVLLKLILIFHTILFRKCPETESFIGHDIYLITVIIKYVKTWKQKVPGKLYNVDTVWDISISPRWPLLFTSFGPSIVQTVMLSGLSFLSFETSIYRLCDGWF